MKREIFDKVIKECNNIAAEQSNSPFLDDPQYTVRVAHYTGEYDGEIYIRVISDTILRFTLDKLMKIADSYALNIWVRVINEELTVVLV